MSGFTLLIGVLGAVLGILLDAIITYIAVVRIKKTQTELLDSATEQFTQEIEDISKKLIGQAIESAVRNIYTIVQAQNKPKENEVE